MMSKALPKHLVTALLEQSGMTKAELARSACVSEKAITLCENGEIQQLSHEQLLGIANALGVTVSELLGDPALVADRERHIAETLRLLADHLPTDLPNSDMQAGVDKAREMARQFAEGYAPTFIHST